MSSPLRQSSSSGQQGSLSHLQARREDVHRERREQLQHQHHEQRGLEANSASSSYDDRMSSNAHFQRAPMEQRPHHHEQRPHHHEQRYHFSEQRDQQHSGQQDKLSTSDRYSAWKEQHRQSTYESSSYGSDSRAQPDYPAAATRTTPAYDIRSLEHPPFMPQRSLLTGHAPRQDMQDSLARSRDAVEPTLSPSLRNPQAMSASHEGRSGQPPFNWPERSMADVSPHSSRGELSQPSGPPSMPESQTPSVLAPSVPAPPPAWRPTADEHEQSAIERPGGNAATPICSNCSTLTTPLWRRDGRGGLLCNACGLFVRVKGRPRPVSMKTDVIKSRARRSKVGLPLVGSGAAAAAPDYSIPENARYGSSQDAYRSRDMPGEGSSPETSMSLDRSEESGSWRDGYASREFAASSRMTSGPQGWSNNPESLARPRLPPYGHAGSPREHEPFQPSPSSYGSSVYEGRRSDYFDDTREPLRSGRYPGQGPEPSFAPPAGPPPMLPSTSRIDQQMRLGPSADFAPPSGWRGARLPPLMSETEASNPRLPALLHSSFPPPMRRSSFDRGVVGGAPTLPSPSMNHSDPVDGPSVGSLVRRRSSDSRSAPYPKRRFDEAPPSMQSRPMSSIVDGPPPRLPGLHALQRSSDGPGGSFRLPPLSSLTGTPTGRLSPSDSMQQRRDPMRES